MPHIAMDLAYSQERSSTGWTEVVVVLSCNDKGIELALKQVS